MKILLLSAYDADSHKYWREGLVANLTEHQWTVLTLPGRYFSWRIRGNSMSWAFGEHAATLAEHYDLVIATSMTDLSALRGFVPSLAQIPTIVYFHENQFDYPATAKARPNVEPQILNLYTALCADTVLFNSQYNYQTFIDGVSSLLKKLPDQVPLQTILQLQARSTVLPVPLNNNHRSANAATTWDKYKGLPISKRPLLIAWAARWEYDKGPDKLLAIVKLLVQKDIDFKLCIMGQSFRQIPVEFTQLQRDFSKHIDQFGYAQSSAQYRSWLSAADIFLSTAVHEFQGLSVLEAIDQQCLVALPNRLAYPELVSDKYLYSVDNCDEASTALKLMLKHRDCLQENSNEPLSHSINWHSLKAAYRKVILETAALEPPAQPAVTGNQDIGI